ncbi:MAG: peptidoglycan DD-metalloendopeptidase family protein [Rhizobiaceae bacterium]|nr:peptidoglycan DD-metalloendopeptidase family protein [Rhizobiaceae bacterium]
MTSTPKFRSLPVSRSAKPKSRPHRWQRQHPTVTVRTDGKERIYKVNPLVTSALFCTGALLIIGLMASSSYLYLRDDLSQASLMRQAKMRHLYEDRISSLRTQVDLATSRQMLDQQVVENRVTKLLLRQNELGALQEHVSRLFKRSAPLSPDSANAFVLPKKPQKNEVVLGLKLGSLVGTNNPFAQSHSAQRSTVVAHHEADILDSVESSLAQTERVQIAELSLLKQRADRKLKKLASILSKQGKKLPKNAGVGGPLIELKGGAALVDSINALDSTLGMLQKMRHAAQSLPHGSPTPGKRISSRYGTRKDPFTKRAAVHGGLDYRARRGTPVRATASGRVIKAKRFGGYGKLVEVDHGDGITTRYAHLSKIRVKLGQRIKKGTRVGDVGSTGRSTGPHLHYEVRRGGRTLNPIHFVRLAKRLKPYL